jgi:hypothetical protein
VRRLVTAFMLGSIAVVFVEFGIAVALAAAADVARWDDLRLTLGPFAVLAIERTADTTTATPGVAALALALAGGLLNAAGAAVLTRRE